MKKDIKIVYDNDNVTTPGFTPGSTLIAYGIENLLQKISKLILTRAGSDTFSPSLGTNIKTLLTSSSNDNAEIASLVNLAISQTEDVILMDQADQKLDDAERLVSLELVDIESVGESSWYVEVYVKTAKNETYLIRV